MKRANAVVDIGQGNTLRFFARYNGISRLIFYGGDSFPTENTNRFFKLYDGSSALYTDIVGPDATQQIKDKLRIVVKAAILPSWDSIFYPTPTSEYNN